MSDRVRNLLFIVFFIYCVATQKMLNGYDKMNTDLLQSLSGLMKVCTNGNTHDLNYDYRGK